MNQADGYSFIFWGVLSLLQVAFLPGFLLVTLLKVRDGFLKTWILSFSLSLLINYLMVLLLTALGLYRRGLLLALFLSELLLLAWLWWRKHRLQTGPLQSGDVQRWKEMLAHIASKPLLPQLFSWLFLFAALVTLCQFALALREQWGTVFTGWDAVVSWNRWAVSWAQNSFPSQTWHYPQLLPANCSLTYLFMGTAAIQFFAKALMPLFPLSILLLLLDLALRSRRTGFLAGVYLTGQALTIILWADNFSGLADAPVAFMGLAALYSLLLLRQGTPGSNPRTHWLLGGALAAAAALTKQAGLTIMLLFPLLSILGSDRSQPRPRSRKAAGLLLSQVLLMLTLYLPWSLYTEGQIKAGREQSEVAAVTSSIHEGRTLSGRMRHAWNTLYDHLEKPGPVWIAAGLAFILLGAAVASWRWQLLLMGIPYFFIWALFFSYDLRNLALAVPILATSAGLGLEVSTSWKPLGLLPGKLRGRPWIPALALAILLLAFGSSYSNHKLLRLQGERQRSSGFPAVNLVLYQLLDQGNLKGKILTSYQPLRYLPGLAPLYLDEDFSSLPRLENRLSPHVQYLLYDPARLPPDVDRYLEAKIASGAFVPLQRNLAHYRCLEIRDFPAKVR